MAREQRKRDPNLGLGIGWKTIVASWIGVGVLRRVLDHFFGFTVTWRRLDESTVV